MPEMFYRYEDVSYAVLSNAETESWTSQLRVELREYPVLRRTPKGVWIDVGPQCFGYAHPRFVLLSARKRFACASIEEARESFRARKRRQASIYEARARRARQALALLETMEAA
jgi:hypothetical protein